MEKGETVSFATLLRVEGWLQLLEAEDARRLDKAHINDVNWLPVDREVIKKM